MILGTILVVAAFVAGVILSDKVTKKLSELKTKVMGYL